jgi:competence protein ComEC
MLLQSPSFECDVLLAPHHGSHHSDPRSVAEWCTPDWVVISRGTPLSPDDGPHRFQAVGAQVLTTDKVGAVRFAVRGGDLSLVTGRGIETMSHRAVP